MMFKLKGWAPNYKSMDLEQLRREIRRLQLVNRPVLDKEEKLAFLSQEIRIKSVPPGTADDILRLRPGGIVRVSKPLVSFVSNERKDYV